MTDASAKRPRVLAAGTVGNMLEWYDFAVYGYLAQYIGRQFFPSDDPLSSLFAAFGAFAAGYLARPFGALVFGQIGDAAGRKTLLTISITVMGLSTIVIGLLPTHDQIGPAAGAALVALRILQGISVGGEFPGSVVFLAERTPGERRGLITSFAESGAFAGFLLGSAVAALLNTLFTEAQMSGGLWRVPFLLGAVVMVVGIFLRRSLTEGEAVDRGGSAGLPVVTAVRDHWRAILRVAGLALSANVSFYVMFVFAVSYLTDRMHVSTAKAMDINTIALVILMLVVPLGGHLSDRFGRTRVLLAANILLLAAAYPLFWLIHHQATAAIFLGQAGCALIIGVIFGASPATMAELAPRHVRVTVLSIGYNVSLALFGGTAPAAASYLIERTSDDMAPAYYMMLFAAVSLATVLSLRRGYRDDMET